jgi:hypothetical protein
MHDLSKKRRAPGDRFVLRTLGDATLSVVEENGTSEVLLRLTKPLALAT